MRVFGEIEPSWELPLGHTLQPTNFQAILTAPRISISPSTPPTLENLLLPHQTFLKSRQHSLELAKIAADHWGLNNDILTGLALTALPPLRVSRLSS